MSHWINTIAIIAGYLIGSISFAIIVSALLRLPDPRAVHSCNPGATNVSRDGHWAAGFLTLIGDMFKAIVPIGIATQLGLELSVLTLVGLAAFLGHLFPLYHGFRGGKGGATLMGCLIALHLQTALICAGIWLLVIAATRYVSLANIFMGIAAPLITWWSSGSLFLSVVMMLMAAMLIVRHQTNIRLILAGEENKVGAK